MRLQVPFFRQENLYYCGPAVLQMVFAFFEVSATQSEIAEKAKTNTKEGTTYDGLFSAVSGYGLAYNAKSEANLDDIKEALGKNLPVIVNYIEPGEELGHYAVAVGVDDGYIMLNDPWHGESIRMTTEEFLPRWRGQSADREGNHIRWMMTINRI